MTEDRGEKNHIVWTEAYVVCFNSHPFGGKKTPNTLNAPSPK